MLIHRNHLVLFIMRKSRLVALGTRPFDRWRKKIALHFFLIFKMDEKTVSKNNAKKGCREAPNRTKYRRRKRKFQSNQNTTDESIEFTSSTAKKLRDSKSLGATYNPAIDYVFISFTQFFFQLSNFVQCNVCNDKITFVKTCINGLGFQVQLQCKCKYRVINSCNRIQKDFEINRKFVFVMRLIGVGIRGIKLFCSMMDLSHDFSNHKYYGVLRNIKIAMKTVYDIVLQRAALAEKEILKEKKLPEDRFSVSGDGTWAKRGYSSLVGVTSLIGKFSGKVLDLFVLCKQC